MNIYEKLQKCRVELQNMKLKKSGENKFAKFKYFELADFLPAINKLFFENKLFSNFSIIEEVATLQIINCETPEECIFFKSPTASADKIGTPIQALGAEHTYLRRYLYLNALEITEEDTLDAVIGQNNKKQDKAQKENPKPQAEPNKDDNDIYAFLDEITDITTLQAYYNEAKESVNNIADFNKAVILRKKQLMKGANK